MRRTAVMGGPIVAVFLSSASGALTSGALISSVLISTASISSALAGPWEDGMAAYNRGDYVPAIRLFRPLAEQGNPKAQSVIGVMYRKGEGVAKSSARAFMWFSLAA